jgi:hypothetical protein
MNAKENYNKLKAFISAFPNNVESKKDLLKLKNKTLLQDYYMYRLYFNIDSRKKPSNVIKELRKFKYDNIYFKSEELGIDLTIHKDFNSKDRYTSSSKLIAKVTKAMLGESLTLKSITSEYRNVDVRYKVTESRKVILFDTVQNSFEFMNNLSDSTFINISKADGGYSSSYNKNGLDFLHDYHNQSNDFANNLNPLIEDLNLFIYPY